MRPGALAPNIVAQQRLTGRDKCAACASTIHLRVAFDRLRRIESQDVRDQISGDLRDEAKQTFGGSVAETIATGADTNRPKQGQYNERLC